VVSTTNPKFGFLDRNISIILKLSQKNEVRRLELDSSGLEKGPMVGSCEESFIASCVTVRCSRRTVFLGIV
jgi:hypothetical protein